MNNSLASHLRGLSPDVRWLLIANALSFVGLGLTLQYTLIYLNVARGFDLGVAGLVVSVSGALGLLGSVLSGWLVDRVGARRVLIGAVVVWAASTVAFGFSTSLWTAAISVSIGTLASSMRFPATSALLGVLVDTRDRSRVFSLNYAGLNLGVGLGGVAGGFIIDTSQVWTFTLAFILQACFTLTLLPVLLLRSRIGDTAQTIPHPDAPLIPTPGPVWRDKRFAVLWAISLLFWFNVFQQNGVVPLYGTRELGISPRVLGLGLGLNTLIIVLMQLPVFGALIGKRRSSAGALMFGVIAAGWCLTLLAGAWRDPLAASILLILTPGLIGCAETIMSPVLPPLVLDLAPPGMIGRYNGAYSLNTAVSGILVPLTASLFVEAGLAPWLLAGMIVSCAVAVGLAQLLGRMVGPGLNHITSSAAEPPG